MNHDLNWALIGLGGMGQQHARLIRETPGCKLVAVADPSPAAAARAAEHAPGATFFSHHAEMLARARPDVVVVVTPHDQHARITIESLEAGAHVLVEKPMATTHVDCVAMLDVARRAGRVLTVYHNRRNDGGFLAARAAIEAGLLGNLIEMHSGWLLAPGPETWRGQKQSSGGLFFDLGAHIADWLIRLAASDIVSVSGDVVRLPGKNPELNEDHCVARIHFASGAVGHVTTSGLDLAPVHRLRLVGDRGTLVDDWNWQGGKARVFSRLPGGTIATTEIPYSATEKDIGRKFYDNFVAHLRAQTPLLAPAEEAAAIIRVFNLAEASAAAGGVPQPFAS
jgi:predicted dehydrogenase